MTEKPAKGVEGFLLYDFEEDRHYFRVQRTNPETGKHEFTDYELCAEDIKVTLTSNVISLFERKEGDRMGKVNWSSSYLDPNKRTIRVSGPFKED